MADKNIFLRILLHPALISVVAAAALVVGAIWGVSNWLDDYTEHGREFVLPDLKGKTVAQASNLLSKDGLGYTIIDSMYTTAVAPGCIVDQVPSAGDKVKSGRKIYLYIRASHARLVALPEFTDMSLRQYKGELEGLGFVVKDIKFEPSPFSTVIGVEHNEQKLTAGRKLTEGAHLTLKVGKGSSNEYTDMPSLHSLPIEEAKTKVQNMALNCNVVFDARPANDEQMRNYRVWMQKPLAKTKLNGDETVTLYATTSADKLAEPEETAE